MEIGFSYTQSLINRFDHVVFLKDHENYGVRLQQAELEFLQSDNKFNHNFKILDQNTINFFLQKMN